MTEEKDKRSKQDYDRHDHQKGTRDGQTIERKNGVIVPNKKDSGGTESTGPKKK